MAFLSKYGVARHIYIPLLKFGAAQQAVGADWTPAAGDVKISKDGGAAANVTNLPVAIAMGNGAIWDFSLTATEMQAAQVMVTISDTPVKAVEDDGLIIETFGNASAQLVFDLSVATQAVTVSGTVAANVTQLLGTAWVTPVVAGTPDVNAAKVANLVPSTDAQLAVAVRDVNNLTPAANSLGADVHATATAIPNVSTLDQADVQNAAEAAIDDRVGLIASTIMGYVMDGFYDFADYMKMIVAATAGKTNRTGNVRIFRNPRDNANAITATVSDNGDRSNINYDLP